MSAVPKKKLCWNCEGNVSKEIDNCPYCGVYLHATEEQEDSNWNPSYHSSSKMEEIPSPVYQIQDKDKESTSSSQDADSKESGQSLDLVLLFNQLKHDVFPVLFLMTGSIFFLFGIVLLLFSQNGTFTLQWKERDGLYFLLFALPLVIFGWRFLNQLETNED